MFQNNPLMKIDYDTGVENINIGKRKGGTLCTIIIIYTYVLNQHTSGQL
jgi:hypothetical protein